MYPYIHKCTLAHRYARTHAHTHARTNARTHARTRTHVCTPVRHSNSSSAQILLTQANLTIARDARKAGKLWLGSADSPLSPYSDILVRTVLARNRPEVNPEQELSGCFLAVDLPNERQTRAIVVAVKENLSMFAMLELAGKAASQAMGVAPASIALVDAGLGVGLATQMMEAGVAAILAACGPMPTEMQSGPTALAGVEALSIYSSSLDAPQLLRIQASAEGTNLCRYLTATPANALDNLVLRPLP